MCPKRTPYPLSPSPRPRLILRRFVVISKTPDARSTLPSAVVVVLAAVEQPQRIVSPAPRLAVSCTSAAKEPATTGRVMAGDVRAFEATKRRSCKRKSLKNSMKKY